MATGGPGSVYPSSSQPLDGCLMEAMDCGDGHVGSDNSHRHVVGSSILGEAQISLCDASMKREASHVEDQLSRKAQKRRRSSLSTHRRSITGDVISAFQIDSESGSQTSSESGSQKSSMSDGQSSQTSGTNMAASLLPNPVNIHMDDIVAKMRRQIAVLNEECQQWTDLLHDYEQQEESSGLQAESLTLHVSDVPEDIKQLARSEYMTSGPVDLRSVKARLDTSLLQYKFDREACVQDLKLIQETVETIHMSNQRLSSCLSHAVSEEAHINKDHSETTTEPPDMRQTIIDYLNCS